MSARKRPPSARKIDGIGGGACVLMCVIAYVGGFGPILQDRVAVAQQRAEFENREKDSKASRRQLDSLREQLKQAEARLKQSPVRLVPASQANERIDEIVRLASESGLKVASTTPSAARPEKSFVIVPIRLTGQCTYRSAAAFLGALHAKFPDTAVPGFAMGTSVSASGPVVDEKSREPLAEFTFDLAWYTAATVGNAGSARAGAGE